jgi:hypothetical protein
MRMKDLTFKQVAISIVLLCVVDWAFFQFVYLPRATADERATVFPKSLSTPYPYVWEVVVIGVAVWFIYKFRTRPDLRSWRVAAFAIMFASLCGLAATLVIRVSWGL